MNRMIEGFCDPSLLLLSPLCSFSSSSSFLPLSPIRSCRTHLLFLSYSLPPDWPPSSLFCLPPVLPSLPSPLFNLCVRLDLLFAFGNRLEKLPLRPVPFLPSPAPPRRRRLTCLRYLHLSPPPSLCSFLRSPPFRLGRTSFPSIKSSPAAAPLPDPPFPPICTPPPSPLDKKR